MTEPSSMSEVANYHSSGFFAARVPLLPFAASQAETEAAPPERSNLLEDTVSMPRFREAMWLVSPMLLEAASSSHTDRYREALPALTAYAYRARSRPTPLGLFGTVSLGTIGEPASLKVGGVDSITTSSRLAPEIVNAIVARVESDPDLRRGLIYEVNPTVYSHAGRIRLLTRPRDSYDDQSLELVAIEIDDYVRAALDGARDGATVESLVSAFVETGMLEADAEAFVRDLVEVGVLVARLRPPITGEQYPLDWITRELSRRNRHHAFTGTLRNVTTEMRVIDTLDDPAARLHKYEAVMESLVHLEIADRRKPVFQVDACRHADLRLPASVVGEVVEGVRTLLALSPQFDEPMERFAARFVERYGEYAVPLSVALDEDIGIGFPTGTNWDGLQRDLQAPKSRMRLSSSRLLNLVRTSYERGAEEVALKLSDLTELHGEPLAAYPSALQAVFTIVAPSAEALGTGNFKIVLHGALGPPGVQMLSRFGFVVPGLSEALHRHLQGEAATASDEVFAEVVHSPRTKLENLSTRPDFGRVEILTSPRLGGGEAALRANDILVSVNEDVSRGRVRRSVVLRRRSDGAVIQPRLSTSHNYWLGHPAVYRFLCDLQRQGCPFPLRWDWGALVESERLPRVTCGRVILSRAQWTLSEVARSRFATVDDFRRWAHLVGLPRWFTLAEGDNELTVDQLSKPSLELLMHYTKGRRSTTLIEMVPGPDALAVASPEGRYVHEIVLPMVRADSTEEVAGSRDCLDEIVPTIDRMSDGWLYGKLYVGPGDADRLLADVILPASDELIEREMISKWFFVRYADPDFHLRVRFFVDKEGQYPGVVGMFRDRLAPHIENGTIWRVCYDTYRPEVRRYGGLEGVRLAEEFGHQDSVFVGRALRHLRQRGMSAGDRLLVGVAAVHRLLDDFGIETAARRLWVRAQISGLRDVLDKSIDRRALGREYRHARASVVDLLTSGGSNDFGVLVEALLDARSQGIRATVQEVSRRATRTGAPLSGTLSTYAHMHINRLARSDGYELEMLVYEYLDRFYTQVLARGERTGSSGA